MNPEQTTPKHKQMREQFNPDSTILFHKTFVKSGDFPLYILRDHSHSVGPEVYGICACTFF